VQRTRMPEQTTDQEPEVLEALRSGQLSAYRRLPNGSLVEVAKKFWRNKTTWDLLTSECIFKSEEVLKLYPPGRGAKGTEEQFFDMIYREIIQNAPARGRA
jgi:hypothetical protein